MAVSVIVPFTSDDLWRTRAGRYVISGYRAAGYDVTVGGCDGPWRKAVAVTGAARHATGKVLVVADADCLCGGVAAAVAAVDAGAAWAMPHELVHRLDQAATEAVYEGADPAATAGRTQRPYRGWPGGGIVVVARAIWDRVPLDRRFDGWGQEDESWALALTTLAGPPARGDAALYHLWHPPQPRLGRRWGSRSSRALYQRYRAASGDPEAMAALLADAA